MSNDNNKRPAQPDHIWTDAELLEEALRRQRRRSLGLPLYAPVRPKNATRRIESDSAGSKLND